jgi:hypothetical protein
VGLLADVFARECGWRDRAHMYSEPDLHGDVARGRRTAPSILRSCKFTWARLEAEFPSQAARFVYETWRLSHRERWDSLCDDLLELLVVSIRRTIEGLPTSRAFRVSNPRRRCRSRSMRARRGRPTTRAVVSGRFIAMPTPRVNPN